MSFLRDYLDAVGESESPEMFHTFAAFIALSSFSSGKVWFDLGHIKVLPNIYVCLVGPPGVKKTTAMAICKRLLREIKEIPLSAEAQTKESIMQEMSGKGEDKGFRRQVIDPITKKPIVWTPLTICVTELSNFFGFNADQMVDFLTTIYDEPIYEVKTKNKGNDFITGPYLNLLGCTTPSWIYSYLKKEVLTGGFARRCMFIFERQESKRVPIPKVTEAQKEAWTRLEAASRRILKLVGGFRIEDDALDFYTHWYMTRKEPNDEIVQGFSKSLHIQMFKLGMLIAISETEQLVMKKEHLQFALSLLEKVQGQMSSLFCGVGENPLNAQAARIVELLDKQPGKQLTEQQLRIKAFAFVRPQDFREILLHLQTAKVITRKKNTKSMEHVIVLNRTDAADQLQSQPQFDHKP